MSFFLFPFTFRPHQRVFYFFFFFPTIPEGSCHLALFFTLSRPSPLKIAPLNPIRLLRNQIPLHGGLPLSLTAFPPSASDTPQTKKKQFFSDVGQFFSTLSNPDFTPAPTFQSFFNLYPPEWLPHLSFPQSQEVLWQIFNKRLSFTRMVSTEFLTGGAFPLPVFYHL